MSVDGPWGPITHNNPVNDLLRLHPDTPIKSLDIIIGQGRKDIGIKASQYLPVSHLSKTCGHNAIQWGSNRNKKRGPLTHPLTEGLYLFQRQILQAKTLTNRRAGLCISLRQHGQGHHRKPSRRVTDKDGTFGKIPLTLNIMAKTVSRDDGPLAEAIFFHLF